MFEFAEYGVDEGVKENAKDIITPALVSFVEYATSIAPNLQDDERLNEIFGHAVWNADQLVRLLFGETTEPEVATIDLWENNDLQAIQERVVAWNKLLKN